MRQDRDGDDVVMPSLDIPRIAGVYHDTLGGGMTSQADRDTSDALRSKVPEYRDFVHQNRAFVRRAVNDFARLGIDQFVDVGCGQPGIGSVYELVRRHDVRAPVLHVDSDAIVVETVRGKIDADPYSAVVLADLVDADSIFDDPAARELIDWNRPVGIVAGAVFHSVVDTDRLRTALRTYFTRVWPGSVLCASHADGSILPPAQYKEAIALLAEVGIAVVSRNIDEFQSLFGPWHIADDGVVPLPQWRPELDAVSADADSLGHGVMATKPYTETRIGKGERA